MGQHCQLRLGANPRLAGILIYTYLHNQIAIQLAKHQIIPHPYNNQTLTHHAVKSYIDILLILPVLPSRVRPCGGKRCPALKKKKKLYFMLLLYWYGQLVGHQPLAVYLCVSECVCLCVRGHFAFLVGA